MSLKIAAKTINKLFWMILHKKQNPENVAYFKSVLAEGRLQ
ncbi:MAG TPA: hypothetical protein QGH36_04945 [Candidatus Marinimicrobia bacterium]|jgi:hypothetical protein|nr:hypothetical protein [Candidatus Neomarinimicrobiota bacterium]